MRISISLSIDVPDATRLIDLSTALTFAKKRLQDAATDVEAKLPKGGRARAGRMRLESGASRKT